MGNRIFALVVALFIIPLAAVAQTPILQQNGNHVAVVAPAATPGSLKLVSPNTNAIELWVNGASQVNLTDGVLAATTDNDVDLGTASIEFKDGYFDGKVKTDALEVDVSDITATASGVTLALQEATSGAKCMGTVTANGTTAVTVATTCATTGSRIFLTRSSAPSGTAICWQTNIVNGVSFDLDCSGAETGTFDWLILHEAP